MNITDVRVRKVSEEGKMKAVISITFDDEFVVHDIKIIEGQNGPSSRCRHEKWAKAISEILLTRLIRKQETKSKTLYLQNTKKYLQSSQNKRKLNRTKICRAEINKLYRAVFLIFKLITFYTLYII